MGPDELLQDLEAGNAAGHGPLEPRPGSAG